VRDMPIMVKDRPVNEVRVYSLPWALFAGTDEWCRKHHGGQSLEMIARRGGFDAHEALRIVGNLTNFPDHLSNDDAHRILYALAVMYRRGQRSIVEGTDTLPSAQPESK
jgi:hypothetical protein